MKKYKVELTEKQLSTLSAACEILARLGIGQWRGAFDRLPLSKNIEWSDYHEDIDAIGKVISKYMISKIDGYHSSLGIIHDDVSESSKVAWDLYQSFRHELAWDYAIEKGWVESRESERNWNEMMGVHYDAPFKTSDQPLAKITDGGEL